MLECAEFRNFLPFIEKAREACLKCAHRVADQFEQILKMVSFAFGAQPPVEDRKLSRFAC